MATKISFTIPRDLAEQEQRELRTTLMDALHEFTTRRYPAAVYVENRYPNLRGQERLAKTLQVDRRVALGKALWDATFDAEVSSPSPRTEGKP